MINILISISLSFTWFTTISEKFSCLIDGDGGGGGDDEKDDDDGGGGGDDEEDDDDGGDENDDDEDDDGGDGNDDGDDENDDGDEEDNESDNDKDVAMMKMTTRMTHERSWGVEEDVGDSTRKDRCRLRAQ